MPHERLARTEFVIDISMVMEELVPLQGIRLHHASAPTMALAERRDAGRQVLYLLRTVSNQGSAWARRIDKMINADRTLRAHGSEVRQQTASTLV